VNTNSKGRAFPIVGENINHKLGRLYSARRTTEEAANTRRTNYSNYRHKTSQKGGSSWYCTHTLEEHVSMLYFNNFRRTDMISPCLRECNIVIDRPTTKKRQNQTQKQKIPNTQ
jgi:hypothetical protein